MNYGPLLLIGRAKSTRNARDCVLCTCGRKFTARVSHLKSGKVKACSGCTKDLKRFEAGRGD